MTTLSFPSVHPGANNELIYGIATRAHHKKRIAERLQLIDQVLLAEQNGRHNIHTFSASEEVFRSSLTLLLLTANTVLRNQGHSVRTTHNINTCPSTFKGRCISILNDIPEFNITRVKWVLALVVDNH